MLQRKETGVIENAQSKTTKYRKKERKTRIGTKNKGNE